MSRSTVGMGLVGVAWDDGDHDEPQRLTAPTPIPPLARRLVLFPFRERFPHGLRSDLVTNLSQGADAGR